MSKVVGYPAMQVMEEITELRNRIDKMEDTPLDTDYRIAREHIAQNVYTKDGNLIDSESFYWNEKYNLFQSTQDGLFFDLYDGELNHCRFIVENGCTFKGGKNHKTGHNMGFSCRFDTGSNCTFDTKWDCVFDTGDSCTFNTDSLCNFRTGDSCTFNTGTRCKFVTGNHCVFRGGLNEFYGIYEHEFDTGDNCKFTHPLGGRIKYKTGDNCIFNISTAEYAFDIGDDCEINVCHMYYRKFDIGINAKVKLKDIRELENE